VAVVGFSLRCRAVGLRGRVRDPHRHESRLYSRAPKGERAYGRGPRNRGKNTTLIAAITLEGAMGQEAAMVVEGATDAEVFEGYYVEHFLAPSLSEGQVVVVVVVVMDKLGAHRTGRVRELIEARGAE
jgi:hypothetical protein